MHGRLPERDRDLLRVLDDRMTLAARLAGERLACGPGCIDCCIGPFPITPLDAVRLACALDALAREDPGRHARVVERATFTAAVLREDFPGDAATGELADDDAEEGFLTRHAAVPCPALDPDARTCDLYRCRPISCRTFGPPVRIDGEDLPPCRLCFVEAEPDVVDRCRVEPDPDDIEDGILEAMGAGDAHTFIAFALADAAGR